MIDLKEVVKLGGPKDKIIIVGMEESEDEDSVTVNLVASDNMDQFDYISGILALIENIKDSDEYVYNFLMDILNGKLEVDGTNITAANFLPTIIDENEPKPKNKKDIFTVIK